MSPIRFVMVGGFLGAGKTTTVARLAGEFQSRGQQVAVITNDHASELVDSHTLQTLGFNVGEIAGACFCGNLDELIAAVDGVGATLRPDVVLVEPIGSCTDLVATVARPLQRQFAARFEVAPYTVLLKPSHGLKILRGLPGSGFSPQAEYIFRKQLEEADLVAINRIDQLPAEQIVELETRLHEQYPTMPVVKVSAKTGQRFESFLPLLEQQGPFGQRVIELDYEQYAAGEAELGWLNCSLLAHGEHSFDLDRWLTVPLNHLRDAFIAQGLEPAHLKAIGLWEGACSVANLVASNLPVELSRASGSQVPKAHAIINARVAADPQQLKTLVSAALQAASSAQGVTISDQQMQS